MDCKFFAGTCESILYESTERSTSFAITGIRQYLTVDEELQIHQQFHNTWRWNNQVMWSGMPREYAQAWADKHDMATLTTAMGPLMTPEHPLCLRRQKSSGGWSKYIKGASAVFAWHILRGERVIVLSPPPPERFHPFGNTNYQAIEEPILKGKKDGGARLRLEMVHPMVEGAEDFIYQIWPVDQTSTWVERFGTLAQKARCWRSVKGMAGKAGIMSISAVRDGVVALAQESKFDGNTREAARDEILEEKAAKEKAAKEKAAKEKAAKEKAAKEKAAKEKAAKEKAAKEKAAKKKAAKEKAAKEKAAKEKAAKEKAAKKKAAKEKAAKEKAAKENAAKEKAAKKKAAKEKAAKEKAAKEKAAKEKTAKEKTSLKEKEQALKEKAAKARILKVAKKKALKERR